MTSQGRNALVGLFVLGALFCLGAIIIKFSEEKMSFGKSYIVKVHFENVSGVREGTQVDLAGKSVGRVLEVEFVDLDNPGMGVTAFLSIRKEYRIPAGSIVEVGAPLMGQAKINIQPPKHKPGEKYTFLPQDGQGQLFGELGNPLDDLIPPELMAVLFDTVTEVRVLVKSLIPAANAATALLEQRTIEDTTTQPGEEPVLPNVYTAIQRLDQVLQDIHNVLGDIDNQRHLKATLAHLDEASANFTDATVDAQAFLKAAGVAATQASDVLDNVNGGITTLRVDLKQLTTNLNTGTATLVKILDDFHIASQDIASGKGTIGMLIKDPKFYEELLLTAQLLSSTVEELNVLIKQWQEQGLLGALK